ncbi:cytochrome c oxidase subunit 3 [Pseudogemmobacter blasticus]|uniref:Cytochrome c oxidase subunit 3 n=1 Tax=Fuscovulum blasticum DSM 2131 TaxID=1188250 RepID=A0A2T4J8T2_FUSBL|nr:cytochrome c oxidase subunit 3 [Fuscovulum blasticum]AWD21171.1 cytochrome c oxidase subunit 3 [Fuscovulum blasticum]PTE14301.1 cytochrome c oxidase subunit 3 [Fuscovulum blasticum DSM 2131]
MAHAKNHDYHVLPPSIWPFLGALGAFIMLFGAVLMISPRVSADSALSQPWLFLIGLVMVLYVMFAWWTDVVKEGQGIDHTPVVRIGLRYGFIMFIMSEVMFFAAWFWTFFKHRMYPMGPESPWVDGVWPPLVNGVPVETFDPWHLPLINTLVLLLSGCAVTWAHHALVHENNRKDMITGLAIAVVLGVCFTFLQAYEYSHAAFGFRDNIYGAAFFMATGFHGAHVIIGTIFLAVCLFRAMKGHFTPERHVGFEAAAWYWHFVDVVWLFLFAAVYVWGRA